MAPRGLQLGALERAHGGGAFAWPLQANLALGHVADRVTAAAID